MDLDAIEARANAATEGPWDYSGLTLWGRDDICRIKATTPEDRAFTVAARSDVPALVARVRELEEENEKLRDDLDAATEFWIATERGRIEIRYQAAISEDCGDWWIEVPWKPLKGGRMENVDNRNVALSRARDIAKEETRPGACAHHVDGLIIGKHACTLAPGHADDHQSADGTLWENLTD